jgi:hypothetical protein
VSRFVKPVKRLTHYCVTGSPTVISSCGGGAMIESKNSQITTVASFIPQVFYDLIARIYPGSLLILSTLHITCDEQTCDITSLIANFSSFSVKLSSDLIIFLSFIMASYLLSVVLDGFYKLLENFYKQFHFRIYRHILKPETIPPNFFERQMKEVVIETLSESRKLFQGIEPSDFPHVSVMYDAIRMVNPSAGARLVKLRAEFHMARITVVGFMILFAVNLLINYGKYADEIFLFNGVCVVLICAFSVVFVQRRKRFLWGLCTHWLLLGDRVVQDASKANAAS